MAKISQGRGFDAEPRVRRIIIRNNVLRKRQVAFRASQAILRVIKGNIRSQGSGFWAPLKCRRGKALIHRLRDWIKEKTQSGWKVYADPFWWVTHLEGKEIKPKKAKVLRFKCGGKVIFARSVVVPRRDPRPTGEQMRRELTNGS